jgi:hypothetical protein
MSAVFRRLDRLSFFSFQRLQLPLFPRFPGPGPPGPVEFSVLLSRHVENNLSPGMRRQFVRAFDLDEQRIFGVVKVGRVAVSAGQMPGASLILVSRMLSLPALLHLGHFASWRNYRGFLGSWNFSRPTKTIYVSAFVGKWTGLILADLHRRKPMPSAPWAFNCVNHSSSRSHIISVQAKSISAW